MSRKSPNKKATETSPNKVFGSNGVLYSFPQGDKGPINIQIDFSKVDEPQSYYYADSFLLNAVDQGMVTVSFGRRDAATSKFADRLDIVMPVKSLFGAFWASVLSNEIDETVNKLLEIGGPLSKLGAVSEPDTLAQTFFGNVLFLAVGDGDSTLDFYHLSARQIHMGKTLKKDIQLLPSVRVIISTVLTHHFLDAVRSNAADQPFINRNLEGSRRAANSR